MKKNISNYFISPHDTIKTAMRKIDKSGWNIAIITDAKQQLMGVASDGDIRRALLKGYTLSTPISKIMKKDPLFLREDVDDNKVLKIMLSRRISQIPILKKSDNTVVSIKLLSDLKQIPLSSPDITSKEIKIIQEVLSTPYLSIGPKVIEFEKRIADYVGAKYAVAVNSGTSALHLCIRALDIKDGDEVITTPFSFIASANCALYERAVPVFVDIDEKTLCIDPDKIEEKITPRTKAILPVHVFGFPCDMDKIMKIARKHNLSVIEDACEALGTTYKGKKVGAIGDVGVFAFYPNKQITTAEGGMLVTNDEKIAKLCRSMRNQGRDEHSRQSPWLLHNRLGYNYRLNEISAALGVAQIERIDEIIKRRREIAETYNEKLRNQKDIILPFYGKRTDISWFVYVIRLNPNKFTTEDRSQIMEKLKKQGIACSNYFPPIHLMKFYTEKFGYKKGDYPITEKVSETTLALPFYNNIKSSEIDYVCSTLVKTLKEFKRG